MSCSCIHFLPSCGPHFLRELPYSLLTPKFSLKESRDAAHSLFPQLGQGRQLKICKCWHLRVAMQAGSWSGAQSFGHFPGLSALGRRAIEKPTHAYTVNNRGTFAKQLSPPPHFLHQTFQGCSQTSITQNLLEARRSLGGLSGRSEFLGGVCGAAHCGLEPLRTKAGFGSILGWRSHTRSSERGGGGGSQFEKVCGMIPIPSSIGESRLWNPPLRQRVTS